MLKYLKQANWHLVVLLLYLIMLMLPILPASYISAASNVTGADFRGVLTVSNNGTATTLVSSNSNVLSVALTGAGYMTAGATDTAVVNTSGTDIAYMPHDSNSWVFWVPSIDGSGYLSYVLYTGGTTSGGKVRWFPGSAGGSTADAAGLELGGNFTIEQKANFNTSSGSEKYSVRKDKAFAIDCGSSISGSITAGIIDGDIGQVANDNYIDFYGGVTRIGERFTNFPAGVIYGIEAYLVRASGSTADNITATVRKASDDTLLGTLAVLDSSTIGGVMEWVVFDDTPVYNPATQDIRIQIEYSGANSIRGRYVSGDGLAGAQLTRYSGSYTDTAGSDYTFRNLTYASAFVTDAVATGEHTVKVSADGTDLKLYIDNTEVDSAALGAISVPDNANNWQFMSSNSTAYAGSDGGEIQKIWVGGNLRQSIIWEYGVATFTDQSGNGNDLTPTYITDSSDENVFVTLSSFGPASEAQAPAYALTGGTSTFLTTGNMTGDYSTSIAPTFPGADLWVDAAAAGEMPVQLPLMIITAVVIIIASLFSSWLTKRFGNANVFVKVIIILCFMGICTGVGIYDFWMVLTFGILGVALAFASQQRGIA